MKRNFISLLLVPVISIAAYGQQTPKKTNVSDTEVSGTSTASPLTPDPVVKHDAGKVSTPVAAMGAPRATLPKTSPASSDEWHYEITPYMWLAGISGNLRVRNTDIRVDSSGSDVLSQVDFAFATRFEAHKNRIGLFVDENYVNLGTSGFLNGPLMTPYAVQPPINIFEVGRRTR